MKKNNKTKINKNKIKKNINKKKSNPKKKIIQKIITEWKKQTNGIVKIDTSTVYKNDYYLMLGNFDDYNNHIHLVLKNKYGNYINNNDHNTIVYFIKKYDKDKSKIVHSKEFKISINVKPSKIVHDMIHNFNNFSS